MALVCFQRIAIPSFGTGTLEMTKNHWNLILICLVQIRIMDCFLCEGRKVMYRIWMAVLILFQRNSSASSANSKKKIGDFFLLEICRLTSVFCRIVRFQGNWFVGYGDGVDEVLPGDAVLAGTTSENSLRHPQLPFSGDGPAVLKNGNVLKVQDDLSHQFHATQEHVGSKITFQRFIAHQPIPNQHSDDFPHADHS